MAFVLYDTKPTTEYAAFDRAFDWFNSELFGGLLPACLITLQRKPRARGYFSPERFSGRQADRRTDEIALNPDTFGDRTDKEILSTLVHEMAHLWQAHFGDPGRGRYHNKEWADKMLEIGLHPSSTAQPGGKMTGDAVSHYILEDGPFSKSADRLLATGFRLNWQSGGGHAAGGTGNPSGAGPAPRKDKVKYTCPGCGINVWGKSGLQLACMECGGEPLTEAE